jgi:hypothetical protein
MPILSQNFGKNVRHRLAHKVLVALNNAFSGGTTDQVFTKLSATEDDYGWADAAGGAGLTTKGDLLGHDGTDEVRIPVHATDGHMIEVHAASAAGLRYVAKPSGTVASPGTRMDALFSNAGATAYESHEFIVNVVAFGADPTGVADSAAAFRSARDWIDTNLSGFGMIFVPAGEYLFTTTETVSVRGTNRTTHCHIHEGIHVVGSGFGSGRSQGAGDNQLAPTTIRSTATVWAIFLMHATGDVPDWRGASIRQLHIKDDSASNNSVDNGIVVSGGLIYAHIEHVSISNIEKTTGWGIHWFRANNNQPSQYGRVTDVIISRSYNGMWIEGNAPDTIITRLSILRDGLTGGNGTVTAKCNSLMSVLKLAMPVTVEASTSSSITSTLRVTPG